MEVITWNDDRFPQNLKIIKNPPKILYVEGNLDLLKNPIISVIGSRRCSQNGRNLAKQFTKDLVFQDITIASGMALGIDTVAHQTALQENGKTIAVLPNGLKHIFPKENKDLYEHIVRNDGLILTEYPPDVKPKSQYFLERNRIVSGIALGILVIEAAYRSGTSVTAKLAKEQGKKVFALPHEITDKHGKGTNRLIQEGAKAVVCAKDLLNAFPFLPYKKTSALKEINVNKKVCTNPDYFEIYQLISDKPISLEAISKKSSERITHINQILLMLELEGLIEKVAGGYVCILNK